MISIYIALFIPFWHWIADFICQTDYQAVNKSSSNVALLEHTLTYSLLWIIPAIVMLGILHGCFFVMITLIAHTITDWFTSRLNSRLWAEKKMHWFFVSIGADQHLCHLPQLFLTYLLLI